MKKQKGLILVKKTSKKKGLMNRLVSMFLTAALVVNLSGSPVYAYDAVNAAVEPAGNVWAGFAKDNRNSLPAYAKGSDGINRRPDVGEVTEGEKEIISASDSGITAAIQDQKITMSGWGGSLELAPESGCFDRAEATNCAVRYTNVSRNIDDQFSAINGEAQVKALYEGVGECNFFKYSDVGMKEYFLLLFIFRFAYLYK